MALIAKFMMKATGTETCTLCGKVVPYDEVTHLNLYVIGSEGIKVCLSCRMVLTKVAEGIMRLSGETRMAGYQEGLKNAREYDKQNPPKNS